MEESHIKRMNQAAMLLMVAASGLHLVQLFLYEFNVKWLITCTGAVAYAAASLGIYQRRAYGYYITALVPATGVVIVGLFTLFGLREQIGYGEINHYTRAAAAVEIPAIAICIFLILKFFNPLKKATPLGANP